MASTSSFRASSTSTPSIPQTSYDVFLSFRGEDTRYNFTDHLYKALLNRGVRTFRDDKLTRGESMAPELLKVIEESRSSVIVFSENYAHSTWCLDELVKIMECKKDMGHTVFPIFYHVDPSHVRNQTGSFGAAFAGYEKKFHVRKQTGSFGAAFASFFKMAFVSFFASFFKFHVRKQTGSFGAAFAGYENNWKEKIQRWRRALTEAANLSGWHLVDGYESEHIKKMTDSIFRILNCMRFDVGANLVGIDSRVKEMILRLHMEYNDVRIVGMYGVGGMGKTTLAKVIYNKLSCEFECTSFLENIAGVSNTRGLPHLRNQLLSDIFKEDHGASMIKKRVFIVLDDVDDSEQLEYLLRNRGSLGEGSRVIITTRNKHLLTVQEVDDLYEVKELNFEEAYKLFNLYAFKHNLPKSDFINLSQHAVRYCQGLPLALKVVGSLLFNKTIPQWKDELHKLDREPEVKIYNVLKRSYDGLDRTEKSIFLDVACFLKGEDRGSVSRILDGCNFYAERGIKNLNDKCLITVPYNQIHMHDLIQQMGWGIVREKFPDEPDKWSRLWDPHDIELAFLTNEGIKGIQTISLDLSKLKRVCFNSNVFAKMTRLRLLKVDLGFSFCKVKGYEYGEYYSFLYDETELQQRERVVMEIVSKMQPNLDFEFPSYELRYFYWVGYPMDFLPSNFNGENLVELHLRHSNIKQLWQENKYLERLKIIDLSYSRKLIHMPDFSSMLNLETLIFQGCVGLIDIHPSIGVLKKLTSLNLRWCDKLKGLPSSIGNLESLQILDLFKCSSFEKFPEIRGSMRSLRCLILYETAIRELPSSIDLESVKRLDLSYCSKFEKFSEKMVNMKSLRELFLNNTAIKDLPDSIRDLEFLEVLDLSFCSKFEKFPEKGGNMKSLRILRLNNTAIKDLPDSIRDLESLEALDLSFCSKFEKFPEKGGNMKSLRILFLNNTAIKDLPDSIGDLESLEILDLSYCSKFEKFPEKGGNMKSLGRFYLNNTAIKDLPDSIGDLESLEILELSYCSNFEKFPEMEMKRLRHLHLRGTAIEELPSSIDNLNGLMKLDIGECKNLRSLPDISRMKFLKSLILGGCSELWEGSICNRLWNLGKLNISHCKMDGQILELPSSLEIIDAQDSTSEEDLSSLLWLCHLNWLKSVTEELKCWKLTIAIPASSGILEWIGHQKLGENVTTELPMNWYEDPDFVGFVVSCVYQPISYAYNCICELNLYGNGFGFKDECKLARWYGNRSNFNDLVNQVWVWWYPKIAIPEEHRHKFTHFNASFGGDDFTNFNDSTCYVKKCGANIIFAGGEHKKHVPMLLDRVGNFGGNRSVVLEDNNRNCKRKHDVSLRTLTHAVEGPPYKRLRAFNTNLMH